MSMTNSLESRKCARDMHEKDKPELYKNCATFLYFCRYPGHAFICLECTPSLCHRNSFPKRSIPEVNDADHKGVNQCLMNVLQNGVVESDLGLKDSSILMVSISG